MASRWGFHNRSFERISKGASPSQKTIKHKNNWAIIESVVKQPTMLTNKQKKSPLTLSEIFIEIIL